MRHEDELLIVPQAAYLLGRSRTSTEKLVLTGVLLAVDGNHRRLIKASDLKKYVDHQVEKYERVMEWKNTRDKNEYWKQSGYRGSQAMEEGRLTVPQVAFLLQRSRQGVHYLCQKGFLNVEYLPMPRGREGRCRTLVEADSVISYAQSRTERFSKAQEYFECKDTYCFWHSSEKDFEEKFTKKEREKYRRYAKV